MKDLLIFYKIYITWKYYKKYYRNLFRKKFC